MCLCMYRPRRGRTPVGTLIDRKSRADALRLSILVATELPDRLGPVSPIVCPRIGLYAWRPLYRLRPPAARFRAGTVWPCRANMDASCLQGLRAGRVRSPERRIGAHGEQRRLAKAASRRRGEASRSARRGRHRHARPDAGCGRARRRSPLRSPRTRPSAPRGRSRSLRTARSPLPVSAPERARLGLGAEGLIDCILAYRSAVVCCRAGQSIRNVVNLVRIVML